MEPLGLAMAEKLNKAKGPTKVIFPLQGFSFANRHVDKDEFDDPESDYLLYETLKRNLRSDIEIVQCDMHINDEAFADKAADLYIGLYRQKRET